MKLSLTTEERIEELVEQFNAKVLYMEGEINEVHYQYEMPRNLLQPIFTIFMNDLQQWIYDNNEKAKAYVIDGWFICDKFEVHHYNYNADDREMIEPNFIYKGEQKIAIAWYKYPLRSATCNIDFSNKIYEFTAMLKDCLDYLK